MNFTHMQRGGPSRGVLPARDIITNPLPPPPSPMQLAFIARTSVSPSIAAAVSDHTIAAILPLPNFDDIAKIVIAMASFNLWPSSTTSQDGLIAKMVAVGTSGASALAAAPTADVALINARAFFCFGAAQATEWCAANAGPGTGTAPMDTSCPMPPAQQQNILYQAALDWNRAHPTCPIQVDSMCATPPANMSHDDAVAWNSLHPSCQVPVPAATGMGLVPLLLIGAGLAGAYFLFMKPARSRTSRTESVRMNPSRRRHRRHRRAA